VTAIETKQHLQLSVGQEVRLARVQAGLDQFQLADYAGVSRATVSRWENDHGEPSITQWRAIAQATGAWWMLRQPSGELPEPDESPFKTGRFYRLMPVPMSPGQMELPFPSLAATIAAVAG
jgi:transcriptional regulator with XRE-family HTH domain